MKWRYARVSALVLVFMTACLPQARRPPRISPDTGEVERTTLYERYRLEPLDDSTVLRDSERLAISQLDTLTSACPQANALVEPEPFGPLLLGVLGIAAAGLGAGELAATEGNDLFDSDEINAGLIIGGLGAALLAWSLSALLQASSDDVTTLTRSYNRCLRSQLDLDSPRFQSQPQPPPSFAPGPAIIEPTPTSTQTTVLKVRGPR